VQYLSNYSYIVQLKFVDRRQLITQEMTGYNYQLIRCDAYVVWHVRHRPLIGQHDTETTAGQTQQLLIVLSATHAMWFAWHIVSVDNVNGWASVSGDSFSRAQIVLINSWLPVQQIVYQLPIRRLQSASAHESDWCKQRYQVPIVSASPFLTNA